jgi:hypothetical protein
LAAAGIPWLDDAGRRADLHALRHSYGTLLAKAGVGVRKAMELMRHPDMRLTMRVCTDPRLFDLAGAVEQLPIQLETPTKTESMRATGTDGKPTDAGATPPGNSENSKDDMDAGHTQSITYRLAGIENCSASIRGHGGAEELNGTLVTGGNWRQEPRPAGTGKKAGDGIRTHDQQLGRL